MPVNIDVVNTEGQATGTIEVSDALLNHPGNAHVVRVTLDNYLANQRQGTAKTKTRGEVRGGGRKPWKQKGTGRARVGSNRSPLWRGGAILFGPTPRDYRYRINRKTRRQAFQSVLSARNHAGRLIVMEAVGLPAPRTREIVALRARLGIAPGQKVLLLTETVAPELVRASRNLAASAQFPTWIRPLQNLNIFDLLHCDWLVMTTAVLRALEATYP